MIMLDIVHYLRYTEYAQCFRRWLYICLQVTGRYNDKYVDWTLNLAL